MPDLERSLAAIVESGVPGVVALVAEDGETQSAAAGVSDLSTGTPIGVDHAVRIGSVAKIFVATLVLQLVADGAIDLDQRAAERLGVGADTAGRATVRELLNHTSGLPDFDWPALIEAWKTDSELGRRPPDLLAYVAVAAVAPGWRYSNANYLLLALFLETVTGGKLSALLQREIVTPLGLDSTGIDVSAGPDGRARGYLPADNQLYPSANGAPIDATDIRFPGATSIVSTVSDTARFLKGVVTGRLFPPELVEEMLTPVEADGVEWDRYGLGIAEMTSVLGMARSHCGSAWGHLGLDVGYTTVAFTTRDGRRQAVIVANLGPLSEAQLRVVGLAAWSAFCG